MVRHFEELRVYQLAFEAAMRIFELSKEWPSIERFSLTDQVRRSSRSVCGCIAEAWCKRRYPAHWVSKLSDADGEGAETQNWLKFAHACGYLTAPEQQALRAKYEKISGGLIAMMTDPDRWCGPSDRVRESMAEYFPSESDEG